MSITVESSAGQSTMRKSDSFVEFKPSFETSAPQGRVTRVLLNISRGGADATYLREFDLLTESFVDTDGEEQGLALPEAKTRTGYK